MASYDAYDNNKNGFAGMSWMRVPILFYQNRFPYCKNQFNIDLKDNIQYQEDGTTGNTVSNKFTGADAVDGVSLDGSESESGIIYLTRSDFAGTYPKENTKTREMAENVKN